MSRSNGGRPEIGWPEKVNRPLVLLTVVVLIAGTPLVSSLMLSKNIEERTVTIAPDSSYVVHLGIYGYGTYDLRYDCYGGDEGYLLRLDRLNFWLFKSGYDYDYMRYSRLSGSGGGGSGGGGVFWETYYVFVNSGHTHMTIAVTLDSNAYFSLPIALLLLGVMTAVGYAHVRRTEHAKIVEGALPLVVKSRIERRKTITVIMWISGLVMAAVIGIGLVVPLGDISGAFAGMFVFTRLWLITIIGVIIIFKLRRRLQVLEGAPGTILANLTRRLRLSGYMVSETRGTVTVRVSTTSAIRLFAESTADGTVLKYGAAATPRGLSIIVFLMLSYITSYLGFIIALFMLYRSAVFADARIIPRLHNLSKEIDQEIQPDTRDLLIDSLSEGRRLSAEAYEAARSNYHDMVLLLVAVGIVSSTVFATLGYVSWFQGIDASARPAASIFLGLASGLAIPLIGWRFLGRRSRSRVDELRSWAMELERALQREVASVEADDEDSSSFELIAESCKAVPEWLRIRRKGRMFRDPVTWILILILSLVALELAVYGISVLIQGYLAQSALLLGPSACMAILVRLIYVRWRRRQAEDDRELKENLRTRFQNLRKEMEAYLGSV